MNVCVCEVHSSQERRTSHSSENKNSDSCFNTLLDIMLCIKLLQSYPTLCDLMDCSPPGSSVHRILQARILEWVVMPSFRGSPWPRHQACISYASSTGRYVLHHYSHLGSPTRLDSTTYSPSSSVDYKLALAKSFCQWLINSKGIFPLSPWRLSPVPLQLLTFKTPTKMKSGWTVRHSAPGKLVNRSLIARHFQEMISWPQSLHPFISREPLKLVGEAQWLKLPTLVRHCSNHLCELFYNRRSQ